MQNIYFENHIIYRILWPIFPKHNLGSYQIKTRGIDKNLVCLQLFAFDSAKQKKLLQTSTGFVFLQVYRLEIGESFRR